VTPREQWLAASTIVSHFLYSIGGFPASPSSSAATTVKSVTSNLSSTSRHLLRNTNSTKMAALQESPPPSTDPQPKTRYLKKLIRVVSAPARPQSMVELLEPHERQEHTKEKRYSLSPMSSMTPSKPKLNLLSELSMMQATVSRLRAERDEWRNTAECQQQDLVLQQGTIASLEEQIASLHTDLEQDEVERNKMYAYFHKHYDHKLDEAERTIARLRKSDRSKEKVAQRNLRLKTTLQRVFNKKASNRRSLLEALALAKERIDDLEVKGDILLEALERQEDHSESGEEEGEEEGEHTITVVEAEVAFRGVLEDTTFREQSEGWNKFLDELDMLEV
jgi:hypothetical protein